MTTKPIQIKIRVSECPLTAVTVFVDRAEVTRSVRFQPHALGVHEIWVQGITRSMDVDSARVKGTGPCEIQEVSFDIHLVTEAEEEEIGKHEREVKLREIQSEITRLEREKLVLEHRLNRIEKQKSWVTGYVDGMLLMATESAVVPHSTHFNGVYNSPPAASANSFTALSILKFFSDKMKQLTDETRSINQETQKFDDLLSPLRARREKLQQSGADVKAMRESRDVTVVTNVQSIDSGPIELFVTYLVSDASWSPSYDIRIDSEDNSMSLTYFGLVQQGTGEDWNNCSIKLSTAKPSLGGNPPDLHTKTASISYYNNYSYNQRGKYSKHQDMEMDMPYQMLSEQLYESNMDYDRRGPQAASVRTAQVSSGSGGGVSTFTIPHRATIESDNKPHKLSIAILTLLPTIMHYVVPAIDANAYLQSKTRNTSDYPFLPSEKVSVFFDGTFVTTSRMRHVFPGESFHSFLGRDPSVRVDYRPLQQTQQTVGMFSRSKLTRFEQLTHITNNTKSRVHVIVADVLPRSNEDRIKVELSVPTSGELLSNCHAISDGFELSSEQDQDVIGQLFTMNDALIAVDTVLQNKMTHNLIWLKHFEPGERKQIDFAYVVSHPVNEYANIY